MVSLCLHTALCVMLTLKKLEKHFTAITGGLHRGQGEAVATFEYWCPPPPPTLGYNTQGGLIKSPLLPLFRNSVLKSHNNLNSRPPPT